MLQRQPTLTWKISLLNDEDDDDDDNVSDIDDINYDKPNHKKVKNALAKVNISNLLKESDAF